MTLKLSPLNADPGFAQIDNPFDYKNFLNQETSNNGLSARKLMKENVFRFLELSPYRIDVAEYEASLQKVDSNKKENLAFDIALNALNQCKKRNQKKCFLPELSWGTAFWAKDPKSGDALLWTVKHNLYLHMKNEVTKSRASFLLFNHEGNLVWDSRKTSDQSQIHYSWEPEKIPQLLKGLDSQSQALDLIAIKLSRPLNNTPLRFSETLPEPQSFVYKAGYPTKTINRVVSFKKSNSDGRSLFVSGGWTTTPAYAISYATGDFQVGEWNKKGVFSHTTSSDMLPIALKKNSILKDYYLNFGTEGVSGFSGSPVFNDAGDVIALFTGAMGSDLENYYKDFASVGLNSLWIRKLVATTE